MFCENPKYMIFDRRAFKERKSDGKLYNPVRFCRSDTVIACDKPDWKTGEVRYEDEEAFPVRCGICFQCRLAKAREWADRCVMEMIMSEPGQCYFVTLTYAPECLKSSLYVWTDALGNSYDVPLYRLDRGKGSDCELFMKRLRERVNRSEGLDGIRIYYAGEYGGQTGRPHYHFIFFNLPLKDLKKNYVKTDCGHPVVHYRSSLLEETWDHGIVDVEEFTWAAASYVARYTTKKAGINSTEYNDDMNLAGLMPEYTNMSRRPGIGMEYYKINKHDFFNPKRTLCVPGSVESKGRKLNMPSAFRRLYSEELREQMDQINTLLAEGRRDLIPDMLYEETLIRYGNFMQAKEDSIAALKKQQENILNNTDRTYDCYVKDQSEILKRQREAFFRRNRDF